MEDFIKILSNISGYSVKELKERNTDPIIQPEDCLEAMKKAINYTHCCKSDSELLAEHKCKFYVNADWSYLKCDCGKRIKPSEG